ncbi:hypothetical protein V5O48_002165 [Marasmius crinis-equi]|uniref:Uncharacterized protein n=1 Tax=Marasmius crinis-equi TaxID=585013 RepID=A0ABR3FWE1_9AGAR
MNPGSLTAVLKALRQRPILIPHIITLQVVLEVPSPFVMFLPTIRQSQAVSFADIIPSEYRGELEALISMVTRTIRTLVLVDGIFTQILRAPMELRAFTSLTELAAPLHFLWTPQSPFMRRASNTPDHALVDSVWPNISTVWAWITELPNTMEDDMKLDLRHLRTLHRLALVFHLLDNQSVLLYLRRLKVVPTITCVSVEIAQLSPMFPVRDIVRRSYFFDPRVVFIWQGQPDPVQVRAIVEHAGGRAPAIYDLILAVPVRQRLGWPIVIQKVKERRAFGEANAWVYPADLPTLVQLDAGPFCTVPFHPPEHWLVLWSQIIG